MNDVALATFEYVIRFDGDDLICELRVDPADFAEIYRISPATCGDDGCVEACLEQINWCQLYAEEDFGGPLPWRFTDPDDNTDLVCCTDRLGRWTRIS